MLKLSRIVTPNNLLLGVAVSFTFFLCGPKDQLGSAENKTEIKTLTVCELFKDLPSYRGKTVTVTGIYWHGLRQTCGQPFVTGDHVWPSALNLVDSDYLGGGDEPVSFKTDRESWDGLDAITISEAKSGRRVEIWVTMVGKLRARKPYVLDDKRVTGGYGHLGVFPAELVVQRVLDVRVKSNPTYDYRELLGSPRGGLYPEGNPNTVTDGT